MPENGKKYTLSQLRSAWGAGKAVPSTDGDPLVSKWFHSFNGGDVRWQGQILGKAPVSDHYLVQLYEWCGGFPSNQEMVSASSMVDWKFYDTDSAMREAYYGKHERRDGLRGPLPAGGICE